MKIKQILKLCKQRHCIVVYNPKNGYQYLSDGEGCYALMNMPEIESKILLATLGMTSEQEDKFVAMDLPEPEGISFTDEWTDELAADLGDMIIGKRGQMLRPVFTPAGVYMIRDERLRPFDDLEDGYQLYLRRSAEGNPIIAVKHGFELIGILLPAEIDMDALMYDLDRLLAGCMQTQIAKEAETEQMKMEDAT